MKNNIRYTFMLLVAMTLCSSIKAQDLVILHTNDVHSLITPQLTPHLITKKKGFGGYERREAYINEVVKKHGRENVLILDGGDFSMGSSQYAIYKGDVEIELMNVLGYDAVCLGNHEFDRGMEELAHRAKNARFDVLCANYDFANSPLNGLVKPYSIVEKGGKKIGIIGIMLDVERFLTRQDKDKISYQNPIEVLNRLALELKNEHKCDVVIALSHCGLYTGKEGNPSDEQIVPETENVDIIVGGHSHTYLDEMLVIKNRQGKDVIIVQDGAMGEYVGRLDLYW